MNNKENYFVYHAKPTRTTLVGKFEFSAPALDYAKNFSLSNNHVISVVNNNGVCVAKYREGKYYI